MCFRFGRACFGRAFAVVLGFFFLCGEVVLVMAGVGGVLAIGMYGKGKVPASYFSGQTPCLLSVRYFSSCNVLVVVSPKGESR